MKCLTSTRIFLNHRKPYRQSRNSLALPISTGLSPFLSFSSITRRPFSLLAAFLGKNEAKSQARLSDFFRIANLPEQCSEKFEVRAEDECENASTVESLKRLEKEVRTKENKRRIKLLTEKVDYTAWPRHPKEVKISVSCDPTDSGLEDPCVNKELSPEMQMFVEHLHIQGYFKDSSFANQTEFDASLFQNSYARGFIKFAAVRFARNHGEVAKWLSASDLKRVALFGCPSLGRQCVQSAKHMRSYFKIKEHEVCGRCKLKDSCSLATKTGTTPVKSLNMASVTRVLTVYALGSVPKKLTIPDEINASVGRLLKEIVNLSKGGVHETPDLA